MSGWTYGGTASDPSVNGNPGEGSVTYTYKASGAPDSSYTETKPSNAGDYVVRAVVAETANYYGATATNTFSIAKAAPTYTAPTAKTLTYSGSSQALLNAGSTSHGTIQYSADGSTWNTTIPTGKNATSYTVYWRLVGDANHSDVASTSIACSIGKVTPTVTVPTAKVVTYNGSAQALANAGSTNFGTLKYSLDNSNWSTSVPTATNYGSYTVYYKVDGDSNINSVAAQSIACSISEKKVTATVELSQSTYTYSGSACTPTVTVKDGSTVIPASEYTVTYSNNTNAGTAAVTITDNVGGNYEVVGSATFTINKAAGVAGVSNRSLTYSRSAQDLVTVSGNTGTVYYKVGSGSWGTSVPTATTAGSYTIYYYVDASANYNGVASSSSPSSVSTTIAKATPVVSTAPTKVADWTYDGSAHNLASGGAMKHSSSDTTAVAGTFTYDQATNAGTYSSKKWYFTPTDTTNYNSTNGTVSGSVTVSKANAHTAPVANSVTYTGSAIALLKNGSANNKGTLEYSTNGTSGWTTTVPTQTNAGSYDTYWRFTPTDTTNYNSVGATKVTTSIGKANQTAPTAVSSYTTYPNTATATASGGGGQGTLIWTNGNTQRGVGLKTTKAYWAGNSNYNASTQSNEVTLSVAKATPTVTLSATDRMYDGSALYATASVSVPTGGTTPKGTIYYGTSSGATTYSVAYSGSGSVNLSSVSVTNAGNTTVYAYFAPDSTCSGVYNNSDNTSKKLTVMKAGGMISYSTTSVSKTYGNAAFTNTLTKSGDGSVTYASSNTSVATVNSSTGAVTIVKAGSCTITATVSDGTNYTYATKTASYSLSVAKANPVYVAPTANNRTYDTSSAALLVAGSNTTPGSFTYSTSQSGTYSTTIPSQTNAGTYTTWWKFTPTDTTNYNSIGATSVSTTISAKTVSSPTITLSQSTYTYSGSACTPTATVKDGSTTISSSEYTVSYSNNTNAGTATVTITDKSGGNYTVSGSTAFTINKANPTYTAPTARTGLTYSGSSQYLVTAGSTSHGTIQYSSNGTTWSTTRPSSTNAGSYTTYWRLVGDSNHNDVASTSLSTTIAKASRTLSFADAYIVLAPSGNTTKTATPSAGSGDGAITYSISSTAYATINSSSGKVTAKTSDGSAVVTATIAEGTNYLSATASYNLYVFATTHDFDYTGSVNNATLPPGIYKLQVWGAQGGSVSGSYTATGAKGGYSEGELTLTLPTTVYIFVGGQGSSAATSTTGGMQNGGFNGGGGAPRICQYNSGGHNGISYSRPGGGATDISLVDSDVAYSNYRTNRSEASLLARQIVAGGGAGASARYTYSTITNTVSGSSTNGYYIGDVDSYELLPLSVYSSQSGFWHTDGIRTNANFTIRKYRVNAGQKYYFSTKFNAYTDIYAVAWYDSSDNRISYESYRGKSDGTITTFTDVEVTAPSGAYYMYLNTQNSQNYYGCKTYVWEVKGIGPKSSSSYKYYRYPVTAGQTYHVEVGSFSADSDYKPITFGGAISSGLISGGEYYSGWSQSSSGFNGDVTIPSGKSYMYITCGTSNSAPKVTYTTTSTSSGTSNGTQVGGGTSGGGTNPGTQSGGGGELGKGANMTATNYRYASGGGGGGYYGGGASYDNSTTDNINQSGGGSGFVSSDLTNAQTKAGNTSFPSTSGGTETGHEGNGYARITRIG